ncbi:hypothetical protein [Bifidobacterium bombi]|uniref:Membrane associated protein n=1 Tax=Bifidobacterium bombi DSM 19703 TaxID=1341695 RepID=A0A086BNT0_9BIFI|nr:hypothetical protein [Bifidobacterium bombi]KFF30594.1 hypothetical protein BBOMB_1457 [Bifidobacterium bombi DSM 19703]
MDYEWASSVIVLAVIVILMAVLLPRHALKGMDRVVQHKEDKYSTSLHLIDAESGTRFSDGSRESEGGTVMQRAQSTGSGISYERVAKVRQARREAIRRRRMIAGSLLFLTVLVLVLSLILDFSMLFSLIPGTLLALVLVLGARASRQARQWELRLRARRKSLERSSGRALMKARLASKSSALQSEGRTKAVAKQTSEGQHGISSASRSDERDNGVVTSVIAQAEIERIVNQKSGVSEDRKSAKTHKSGSGHASQVAKRGGGAVNGSAGVGSHVSKTQPDSARIAGTVRSVGSADSAESADVHSIDEVEETASGRQDLISFSLGSGETESTQKEEPQSLEIKSTRQVSKAKPVVSPAVDSEPKADGERKSVTPSRPAEQDSAISSRRKEAGTSASLAVPDARVRRDARKPMQRRRAVEEENSLFKSEAIRAHSAVVGQAKAHVASFSDTKAFHAAEKLAEVEAPDASSDSLGEGLKSILVRRNA